MTAAEENLFRRLLSQCDARNRFTPSIPSEDVRAFEALAFELHYIQQANAQGAYMLTPAGQAARRTLIMQDEQHAREEALQAQVESFRQQLIQVQRQAAEAAEQHLSLDEALRAQEESFRQQLIQVQQQSADALERMRKDFAEYQREQNRQNQQNSLDHTKMEKKNRRSTWLQIIFTAVFSPLAALCVEHFQDIVTFFQSLLHE